MIRNYLKVILRQLKKNKGFALLNMFGLSFGLTAAVLILLWIQDEVSYNRFHTKYGELYQVMGNQQYDTKTYTFAATPGLLSPAMKTDFPEVAQTTRLCWGDSWLFTANDKTLYESGNYADASFFSMFTFPKLYGNTGNPFPDDNSIVLTETMAVKYFGTANVVGKYIRVNNKDDFKITAVVADPPQNSSIKFNWLVSFRVFEKKNEWLQSWTNNGVQTFVELKPGTDYKTFNTKFSSYIKTKNADAAAMPLLLAMDDWRLRSTFEEGVQAGGRIEYIRLFGVIAALLIIIACINFMNLATARSEQRAKEVGVRKVMGAQRRALMFQFISESIVMALLAMVIACLFVLAALPWFNELVGKKLSPGFDNPVQWLLLLGIAVLCGIIAGSYPSVYLSSFKPVAIFKGIRGGRNSGAGAVRKGLVITQFVVSIVLIVSTVVIYGQLGHVKNRQLGYNKDHLVYVRQTGKVNEHLDAIINDLRSSGAVTHAASSNQYVLQIGNNSAGFEWKGKDPTKEVLITMEYVSSDYISTAGMKLKAGRDFLQHSTADSQNVIINESFAKLLGSSDPLSMVLLRDSLNYRIVGVINDFVYNDVYGGAPAPLVLFNAPRATNFLFMRLDENKKTEDALAKIEAVFQNNNPGYPFECSFVDQEFDQLFKSEMLVSKLSRLFAAITILISCIGLFGLAAYTAERRTKEISIRKILGASVTGLAGLLSADFLKLVLIAIVIALPLSWFIMHKWLEDYSYRIDMQWWMFALAGFAALVIALLTVSFQAIRAALSNPVKNIRTE